MLQRKCIECDGNKKKPLGERCQLCSGFGLISEKKYIEIMMVDAIVKERKDKKVVLLKWDINNDGIEF